MISLAKSVFTNTYIILIKLLNTEIFLSKAGQTRSLNDLESDK